MAVARRRDVIFMDINMPIMDGLEAARVIRRAEAASAPFAGRAGIIGLNAHVFDPQDGRLLDAGIDDGLLKPLNSETLAAFLERVAAPHQPSA